MSNKIPVSVIITTKNEEKNIARCLDSLQDFDETIVVDSQSNDKTVEIVKSYDIRVESYQWNGQYPKKRQWCLDYLNIKNDFIFFIDADEVITEELVNEIRNLDFCAAGYFVKGQYIWDEKPLKYGLRNNKLCLFHKGKIMFPVVNDLNIDGMGEIEGHYQPVLRPDYMNEPVKQLHEPLLHYAYGSQKEWFKKHKRYAQWEAQMISCQAYPKDPDKYRELLKRFFRRFPMRGVVAFLHSYILKVGFLDGIAGFKFAASRLYYYRLVSAALRTSKNQEKLSEQNKERIAL